MSRTARGPQAGGLVHPKFDPWSNALQPSKTTTLQEGL